QMIRQRESLSGEAVQRASLRAMESAMDLDEFRAAGTIAAYVGIRGEIDPWPSLLAGGLSGALPVIQPRGDLEFVIPDGPLQRGPFGTSQPVRGEKVPPDRLDAVLVPLVAVDSRGNRMGHGAGYYDRTFAFRLSQPAPPVLIGIAHSFQVVALLEPRPWDVPLDIIVTETGILRPEPPIGED
ncbi:MAG: 5-formyltetrahydrofolate cyclo-ligase, partial [Acidimicrobiales bacterium]|nr:5-formyltetrahydrofolate cyclo-ligase [Acidimicrobiales bacterium]